MASLYINGLLYEDVFIQMEGKGVGYIVSPHPGGFIRVWCMCANSIYGIMDVKSWV